MRVQTSNKKCVFNVYAREQSSDEKSVHREPRKMSIGISNQHECKNKTASANPRTASELHWTLILVKKNSLLFLRDIGLLFFYSWINR